MCLVFEDHFFNCSAPSGSAGKIAVEVSWEKDDEHYACAVYGAKFTNFLFGESLVGNAIDDGVCIGRTCIAFTSSIEASYFK